MGLKNGKEKTMKNTIKILNDLKDMADLKFMNVNETNCYVLFYNDGCLPVAYTFNEETAIKAKKKHPDLDYIEIEPYNIKDDELKIYTQDESFKYVNKQWTSEKRTYQTSNYLDLKLALEKHPSCIVADSLDEAIKKFEKNREF